MDPEAVRATVVIVVLAVASVGAAFTYDALVGPPPPGDGVTDDEQVLTLVDFPTVKTQTTTGVMRFDGSGTVIFDPIEVSFDNITSFAATMQVNMRGPSVGDSLSVVITNPEGDQISGEVQRQANPNGYQISEPVVEGWSLAEAPESTHYETSNEAQALRWAAENHTDRSYSGEWLSEVTISPPPTVVRSGNVSLVFTFTHYIAEAFTPEPQPAQGAATGGMFDVRHVRADKDPVPRRSTAFPEPS